MDFSNIEIKSIITISCIFLLIQFVYFTLFTIDNHKVNFEDKLVAKQIEQIINNYEQQTGNTITKISIYSDSNPNYTYDNIKTSKDMNVKAFFHDWSTIAILEFYLNRDFESVSNNEDFSNEFSQNDWNYFDPKQIILDNDTLHLCSY